MRKPAFVACAVVVVTASVWLFAAPLQDPALVLPYRGYLEQNGQPLNGSIDVSVTLYDAFNSVKWSDVFSSVQVANGQLGLQLGSHKALDPALFSGGAALDLEIALITDGGATTLTPRQRLHPVAYAVSAGNAHHASGEFDVDGGVNATSVNATTLTASSASIGDITGKLTADVDAEVKGKLTVDGDAQVNGQLNLPNHNNVAQYLFGGMYFLDNSRPPFLGEKTLYTNVFTRDFSCPPGFAAHPLFSSGDLATCSSSCVGGFTCYYCTTF